MGLSIIDEYRLGKIYHGWQNSDRNELEWLPYSHLLFFEWLQRACSHLACAQHGSDVAGHACAHRCVSRADQGIRVAIGQLEPVTVPLAVVSLSVKLKAQSPLDGVDAGLPCFLHNQSGIGGVVRSRCRAEDQPLHT